MKDPYLYPNSSILINKAGIKQKEALEEFENRITTLGIIDLLQSQPRVQSLYDVFSIHKTLFEGIYPWAGEIRTVGLRKEEPILNGMSVLYSSPKDIKHQLKKLQQDWSRLTWNLIDSIELRNRLLRFVPSLWRIHPFREGNTRTISIFMILIIEQNNHKVNRDFVNQNAKFFRNSLVMASIDEYSEYIHLERFLNQLLNIETSLISNHLRTINDYDIEDYEYASHNELEE
jgi:cell filamentation protein